MSHGPSLRGPHPDAIVAAYLANYLARSERDPEGRPFPAVESAALATWFLSELQDRVPDTLLRSILRALHERFAPAPPLPDSVDSTFNLRLLAWARLQPPAEIDHELVEAGAVAEALGSMAAVGWRALLLAHLARDSDEFSELSGRLRRWLDAQTPRVDARDTAVDLQAVARLAYIGGRAAALENDNALEAAARSTLDAVLRLRVDGPLPGRAWEGSATSSALAQVLVAADLLGHPDAEAVATDLGARLDTERNLIRQEPGGEKFEFSPWIPLSLLPRLETTDRVADVLDPQVEALPAFQVTDVDVRNGLRIRMKNEAGSEEERLITAEQLNLLLDRIVRTIAAKRTSPRQHGHVAIALDEVAALDPAPETRDVIQRLITNSRETILREQQANGGWFYSHQGVPSVVYSAGSQSSTEFPDRQYTIDAAVPGVALCCAFMRTAERRHLDAARRALTFFEETIGRVERDGRMIWRLFPEDDKTARMGTAVNYELWAGYFFSWLLAVEDDEQTQARLRGYLGDIVAYAESHLSENGDIAYGDYVDEKRTAYASWDAFLLREIGTRAAIPDAFAMSRKIVDRLAELTLPSGLVPNVADYFEMFGDHPRWLVHRHGIGPYPYRAYYQFYFAVAGAASATARPAARRALAFNLIQLYEPLTGGVSPGVDGRGRPDIRPGVTARDWALLALARLHDLVGFEYRPDLRAIAPPLTRVDQMLDTLRTRTRSAHADHEVDRAPAAQQRDHGLFDDGSADLCTTTAEAIVGLLDARADQRAARAAAKALARQLFTNRGEGFEDVEHTRPASALGQASATLAFRLVAEQLQMPQFMDFADRATLHLFLAHRRPDGAPGSASADPDTRARDDAKIFDVLTRQREALAAWLERQNSTATADLLSV